MTFEINCNLRQKTGEFEVSMSEAGMTADYCIINGLPSVLFAEFECFYFVEAIYTPVMDDVDYFKYASNGGKILKLLNK